MSLEISNHIHLSAVLETLQEELDDKIGQAVFVPIMENMLQNCNVTGWVKEEGNYRLTFATPIKAIHPKSGRKRFYFEDEFVLKILPNKFTIYFPKVRFLHNDIKAKKEGAKLDPTDKKLNTLWAEMDVFILGTYTAAVYSMRWDSEVSRLKVSSIDDAGSHKGILQTEELTLDQSIKRWASRTFTSTKL
jgi:hypothetical protein